MTKHKFIAGCVGLSLTWAGEINAQQVQLVPPVNMAQPQRDAVACKAPADIKKLPGIDNSAASCPSMFAWRLFVWAFQPKAGSNMVRWQTWATDDETFPFNPKPSQCRNGKGPQAHCPVWPTTTDAKQRHQAVKFSIPPVKSSFHSLSAEQCQAGNCPEIVYRNQESFDYIVKNNLWYQQGLAKRFNGADIQFPVKAIELKTKWVKIAPKNLKKDRQRYFTMEKEGVTYGLVGLHLSSKHQPNWLWATFEHKDNLGRCDYVGCYDFFGNTQPIIKPKKKGGKYPAGNLTKDLMNWMNALAVDKRLKNYRLKGVQINYTDSYGRPIVFGNSAIEVGFAATSSCMSCHVRASFTKEGENVLGFGADRLDQSYNGCPQPAWFNPLWTYGNPPMLKPADFVWALSKAEKAKVPPTQLSPKDGVVSYDYPGYTTDLKWTAVPDATSYQVEIQYKRSNDNRWLPWKKISTTTTEFTFQFLLNTPLNMRGRWRVWAVYPRGEGPKTGWWTFKYRR